MADLSPFLYTVVHECVYLNVSLGAFLSKLYYPVSSPLQAAAAHSVNSEELRKETLVVCLDLLDYMQSLLEPGQTNCISGGWGAAAAGSDLWHSNYSEMLHGYGGSDRKVKLWICSC